MSARHGQRRDTKYQRLNERGSRAGEHRVVVEDSYLRPNVANIILELDNPPFHWACKGGEETEGEKGERELDHGAQDSFYPVTSRAENAFYIS